MERTERIADLLDELSVEDLRRTTLQAIDHAYKSSAEVAEAHGDGAGRAGHDRRPAGREPAAP